jgi:hypothetical protein
VLRVVLLARRYELKLLLLLLLLLLLPISPYPSCPRSRLLLRPRPKEDSRVLLLSQ